MSETHFHFSRRLLILPLAFVLLLFLCAALAQFTEIDSPVVTALRQNTPDGVKEMLRPLRAPQVLAFEPAANAKDIAPQSPIAIYFLTPMSPNDGAIRISPEVKGAWSWSGNKVTFTPAENFPLGATVTVTVTREARSWLFRRAERDLAYSFNVLAAPAIVETSPKQGAAFAFAKTQLMLTFNREMERASVESRLVVAPPIQNMKLEWQANKLLIGGNLRTDTNYRVILTSGAKDARYGLTMPSEFVWQFTTTQQYPYLAIVNIGRYGVTAADKPTTLRLQMTNVSRVDAALYQFDTPTYLQTLAFSYDRWRNFKPKGAPIKTWTLTPNAAIDREVTQDIQLDALPSGFYYLITQSPEGVYDSQVLVATKTALTMKRTADQVLVWATNLADGGPVENLSLAFYNAKGETIGNGATNRDGIFLGAIKETKDDVHLVATRAGDGSTSLTPSFAAVSDEWNSGIEPWRFDGVQWQWNTQKRTHRIYIYTDRPIYRPGQTVFFKGIVRKDDDGAYAQPNAGTEVRVKVSDWNERVLYDKTLKTSAFGSLADSFAINAQAGLGTYQIVARIGDEEYTNEIRVEEYRKPEYSVSATFDRNAYINGDAITATIRANYFFGGPVANAKVRWTLYSNDYYFYWSGGDGSTSLSASFDFGNISDRRFGGYGREISSDDATLNANGELIVKLPTNITSEQHSQIYTLEATVTDAADQPQAALTSAIIHRGTFYVGMRPTSYVAERGREARFDAQTLDTLGKPIGRIALTYDLNLVNWNCYRTKNDKGINTWKCDEIKTEIQRGDFTTDALGKYQLAFTPPRGGAYRLQAQGRDARGNRVLGETWLWVSDREQVVSWRYENNDRIELVLDKKQYNIGDTAQVLIKSPYSKARALVTIERGKIISHQVLSLNSNSATFQLPITNNYYPNVYVSVLLIPDGGFTDGIPSFKMGLAILQVASNAPLLDVSITPLQARYSPRETAAYQIKTRDANGKPVSAELSLAIVDKAVLALASETGNIVDAFYGTRDLAVKTAQSLAVYIERVNVRQDIGGGGGGDEQARKNFLDVAFWSPAITTDANGDAKVEVPLPDNLTTWSAIANAVTAQTQVGKANADALVTKDLIVRPVLPRFMNVGDKASIGTIVNNSTAQTQTISVTLAATNLTLPVTTTQSITLAPNQSARVNWDVTVPRAATAVSSTITMRARGAGVSDAVQLTLPIEPFGEKRILANAGQVEDNETRFAVTVPNDATYATIKLTTTPSLAASLIDSLDYLVGFPYGCVEQTMSRFLPSVLVKQTLTKLNLRNEKVEKDLPQIVDEGLNRLYAFQHSDGGWGWWEGDESQAWETAYVTYGLLQAKRVGAVVDEKTIQRALKYLKTPLVETRDDNLKVYIAYVMSEAGQGDAALARAIADRQSALTLESRALLALLLNAVNETPRAKIIVDDLKRSVIESATNAHWEESAQNKRWEYFASNGRTTAMVLRALLALDRESPLVPKTVRYLLLNRIGGYWRTTQETAQILIALTEYLAQTGELNATFAYEVFVDGASVVKENVARDNIAKKREVELKLNAGEHSVRIVRSGAGRLYYASAVEYYRGAEAVGAIQSLDGPTVRREYLDPKTDKTLSAFKVGDIVRVRLTVEMAREGWYMMVTDPLPAGFEAINYSLNTSGVDPTRAGQFKYYWSHPELRDNRAVFFSTYMWKGKHTFTYLMRATTSGTFRALPAEASPMYEPEVFGRSGSVEVVVK